MLALRPCAVPVSMTFLIIYIYIYLPVMSPKNCKICAYSVQHILSILSFFFKVTLTEGNARPQCKHARPC